MGEETKNPAIEPEIIPFTIPPERMDPEAAKVVRRLAEHGYEAYLVGGCVRDLLFGLRPKDFDVVTSARPNEVRKVFRNCRIIGRRFRLAHVYFRDKIIEVATFRAAVPPPAPPDAGNGELIIRDDNVFGTAEEDARRRDFTINALFYDPAREAILDYVGGVADARKKVVRMIGDPNVRLREDPIRMLRAIRLAARLGCEIDPATWHGIRTWRAEILEAAPPRILEDLLRMFRGGAIAPAFDLMLESSVLATILPELADWLDRARERGREQEVEAMRVVLRAADAWTQSGRELTSAQALSMLLSPVLRAALAEGRKEGLAETAAIDRVLDPIAQRIAISRKDREKIRQLVVNVEKLVPGRRKKGKKRSSGALVRRSYFPELLELFELMCRATGDLLPEVEKWRQRYREAFPDGPPNPEKKKPPRRRRRPRPRA